MKSSSKSCCKTRLCFLFPSFALSGSRSLPLLGIFANTLIFSSALTCNPSELQDIEQLKKAMAINSHQVVENALDHVYIEPWFDVPQYGLQKPTYTHSG